MKDRRRNPNEVTGDQCAVPHLRAVVLERELLLNKRMHSQPLVLHHRVSVHGCRSRRETRGQRRGLLAGRRGLTELTPLALQAHGGSVCVVDVVLVAAARHGDGAKVAEGSVRGWGRTRRGGGVRRWRRLP